MSFGGTSKSMDTEDRLLYGGAVVGLALMWALAGYANAKLNEPVYNAFGNEVGTNNSLWWVLILGMSLLVAFGGTLVLIGSYYTEFVVPRVKAYRRRKAVARMQSTYVDAER